MNMYGNKRTISKACRHDIVQFDHTENQLPCAWPSCGVAGKMRTWSQRTNKTYFRIHSDNRWFWAEEVEID